MNENNLSDMPEFKAIMRKASQPDIGDVVKIAKILKITEASKLWDLFDFLQKEWYEKKKSYDDCD